MPLSDATIILLRWYDNLICIIFLTDFILKQLLEDQEKTSLALKERLERLEKLVVNWSRSSHNTKESESIFQNAIWH